MDDLIIISQVLDGNKNAFAELISRYHKELFRYAYNMLGHYQTTEDMVQNIFIRIYEKLPLYNSTKSSFRTWMYRVAGNLIINYLKSNSYTIKRNEIELNQNLTESVPNETSRSIEQDEKIDQVIIAMKKVLTSKQQQILSYHYFQDFSVNEIAEIMQVNPKAIYKTISISIQKIRKEVVEDE